MKRMTRIKWNLSWRYTCKKFPKLIEIGTIYVVKTAFYANSTSYSNIQISNPSNTSEPLVLYKNEYEIAINLKPSQSENINAGDAM